MYPIGVGEHFEVMIQIWTIRCKLFLFFCSGTEKAYMLVPNRKEIALDGLGYTVGTPPDGITAEVLVVKSFDDLRANASKVSGMVSIKIQM